MESALVNARVPVAKKEAAKQILDSIGATPSDLINAAYDYILSEKKLPVANTEEAPTKKEFEEFVGKTTFDVYWPAITRDAGYRSTIERGRSSGYNRLD